MAIIKEIARRANVSIGTVDRVLHDRGRVSRETEKKVRRIIEQVGYKPNVFAQQLRRSKKKIHFWYFDAKTFSGQQILAVTHQRNE